MKVKVLKLGQTAKELDIPAGTTVEEAINMIGFGYGVNTIEYRAKIVSHKMITEVRQYMPSFRKTALNVYI